MHIRLAADSKLATGVNMSVKGCLSLCAGPAIDWQPVQAVDGWVDFILFLTF